jgi:hypothetical protein
VKKEKTAKLRPSTVLVSRKQAKKSAEQGRGGKNRSTADLRRLLFLIEKEVQSHRGQNRARFVWLFLLILSS